MSSNSALRPKWCNQTKRDVAFQELSKDGVLETSFSLKNQREQFKKSLKKKEVISESNISLPRVETLRVTPNKMLEKLKDDKLSIPMYLMNRDKYIELLSQILETNFSPAVYKLLKRMIRLANLKQHDCCRKIRSMHKKSIKIYENSFSNRTKVVYRCNAALLDVQDNLKLPLINCILDINKSGSAGQIVPCMLDTGSQISVCSFEMF